MDLTMSSAPTEKRPGFLPTARSRPRRIGVSVQAASEFDYAAVFG